MDIEGIPDTMIAAQVVEVPFATQTHSNRSNTALGQVQQTLQDPLRSHAFLAQPQRASTQSRRRIPLSH